MSKTYQLRVPTPCHENWDKMNETEKGRFCLSCQKQVIDFSLMTDRQVLETISKTSGSLCGHFMQDQLNREITVKKERNPGWFRYIWQVAIPAMLMTERSSAQDFKKEKIEFNAPRLTGDTVLVGTVGAVSVKKESNPPFCIKGTITDEDGMGLAGATVMIKGTKKGTATDENGHFQLWSYDHHRSATLVASSVGYLTHESTLGLSRLMSDSVKIEMALSAQVDGMFIVCTKKKKSVVDTLQAVKTVIENAIGLDRGTVKIYPNPVQAGSTLGIAFDLKEGGEFEIAVLTLSGQTLQQKQVLLETGQHVEQIVCDARMTRGMYILEAVNRKTKKRYTSKILVE